MNKLDKQYTDLLQDILDNGVTKQDRTGTGTLSLFGRQIRHKMSDGFPLLTTKKMLFKTIVTELLWFLRGDTNIKYLVDNNCHIWDGDAYKNYLKHNDEVSNYWIKKNPEIESRWKPFTKEEFINKIKTDDEFAKKWGELGPIYGKQWRSWTNYTGDEINEGTYEMTNESIDQIANLINDLKTNPDSRRLMVSAWNVGELEHMVLPPCHYGFQVYTRELSMSEKELWYKNNNINPNEPWYPNIPTRAISLMWNQRSVDTGLGLPFNIASYGLLLEIIAKAVNMVPDELIGNLGDVHLYSNHVEQAKEQIGRELSLNERIDLFKKQQNLSEDVTVTFNVDYNSGAHLILEHEYNIPKRTREPYPLPTLKIVGYPEEYNHPNDERLFEEFGISDFELENYQSHPAIKLPLSN
jgi:thymidylate synthase